MRLRLTIVDPPPGVLCRIQLGKTGCGAFLDPVEGTTFEFTLDDSLRGPASQGRPGERFVYVNWGQSAGQAGSPWQRRAKVSLQGVTPELIATGAVLSASIHGTGRDGGPCCASVPLLREWSP